MLAGSSELPSREGSVAARSPLPSPMMVFLFKSFAMAEPKPPSDKPSHSVLVWLDHALNQIPTGHSASVPSAMPTPVNLPLATEKERGQLKGIWSLVRESDSVTAAKAIARGVTPARSLMHDEFGLAPFEEFLCTRGWVKGESTNAFLEEENEMGVCVPGEQAAVSLLFVGYVDHLLARNLKPEKYLQGLKHWWESSCRDSSRIASKALTLLRQPTERWEARVNSQAKMDNEVQVISGEMMFKGLLRFFPVGLVLSVEKGQSSRTDDAIAFASASYMWTVAGRVSNAACTVSVGQVDQVPGVRRPNPRRA